MNSNHGPSAYQADALTNWAMEAKYFMHIDVYLQKQLYRTIELSQPGYDVTKVLDQIQSDREAGNLSWVNWDQPLDLDIQYFE